MIFDAFKLLDLEFVESIKRKTLQLFDTMQVRFGVMLVGPTGGGKTTTYKLLAESMNVLRNERFSSD